MLNWSIVTDSWETALTTLADVLLRVAGLIPGIAQLVSERRKVDQDQRDRLAVLLEAIAFCIHDMCQEFSAAVDEGRSVKPRRTPTMSWRYQGRCAELELYIANLRDFLPKSIFAAPTAERLLELLLIVRAGPHSAIGMIEGNQGFLVFDIAESREVSRNFQEQMHTTGVSTFIAAPRQLPEPVRERLTEELVKLSSAAGQFRAAAALVRAMS